MPGLKSALDMFMGLCRWRIKNGRLQAKGNRRKKRFWDTIEIII